MSFTFVNKISLYQVCSKITHIMLHRQILTNLFVNQKLTSKRHWNTDT